MYETSIMKRAMDIAVCLALLPIALPVCLVAMVAIRLESPGSPLFIQRRVGRNQRIFNLLKLRTMGRNAGDHPSHEVDSMQITRVGAFLRRTKIDELPQLWNVLTGKMSLVGPRPCLHSQGVLIAERARLGLYAFAPGVTGPAQILGIDMSDPVLLAKTEAGYFHDATALGDIRIILHTATGGGRGDAALKERRG
jgi:lipopolysaccharide/colanic/teichoic acid biosynthesis glycosyltransferase